MNSEYVKQYLIHNKIVFPTNAHDNTMGGFQNWGPIGLKIKNNIIEVWRRLFIKDNIYEIDVPVISPNCVLTRSGHVQKFNDLGIIFYDKQTNKVKEIKRADHWIEEKIEELKLNFQLEINENTVQKIMDEHKLYNKENEYIQIKPISLMFRMDSMNEILYLRPEIAQTIFVEFKQFYDYSKGKLPFGIAQVGKSYRNEISDKPFTRLREFTQAEVEYFFNPMDKFEFKIPHDLINESCFILSAHMQINNIEQLKVKLSELSKYIEDHIILKYIISLYQLAKQIGLNMNLIRFRQHKHDERAHYAKDCWDLESNIFGKWLEIAGLAHRGDYDLSVHDKNSQFKIRKNDNFIIKYKLTPNIKKIFNENSPENAKNIIGQMKTIISDSLYNLDNIDQTNYQVEEFKEYEFIYPNVVEPSIGIDRVFYTLICHNLSLRDDSKRPLLTLNNNCRVWNLMLAQLSNNSELLDVFKNYLNKIEQTNLKVFTDLSSTSIGKRYTRADELGIKYTITIDFDTVKDSTVTVRNSIDMSQIRLNIDEAINFILKSDE